MPQLGAHHMWSHGISNLAIFIPSSRDRGLLVTWSKCRSHTVRSFQLVHESGSLCQSKTSMNTEMEHDAQSQEAHRNTTCFSIDPPTWPHNFTKGRGLKPSSDKKTKLAFCSNFVRLSYLSWDGNWSVSGPSTEMSTDWWETRHCICVQESDSDTTS